MRRDCQDASALASAIKQLRKLDQQLVEHVGQMESFEINSLQDRQKALLSGSSKVLVEEEKFRTQSKKKFEGLSDQILNCVVAIRQLSTSRCTIDFSCLSGQTLDLVNGRSIEKTELMHLHTTTHGTRRWSGDRELTEAIDTAVESHRTPPPPSLSALYSSTPASSMTKGEIQRSTSPLRPRSGSPLKTRAASPVKGQQPIWLPHTKPPKPAPKSTVKRMYHSDDTKENETNWSESDTVINPLARPQKPAPPKSIRRALEIEEESV